MRPEILGIFIPIIFLIGLFTVIALNILFKYKTKEIMAKRTESLDEWHKTDAQVRLAKVEAQASRRNGVILRVSGLVMGLGLGVAIGCMILACSTIDDRNRTIATFIVISLALFFGGAGLIGAWFLEQRLGNRK